jgi:hypothetical protein
MKQPMNTFNVLDNDDEDVSLSTEKIEVIPIPFADGREGIDLIATFSDLRQMNDALTSGKSWFDICYPEGDSYERQEITKEDILSMKDTDGWTHVGKPKKISVHKAHRSKKY